MLVYLAEFMVVDCFLSLAFLAWPIRSPNYFFVVDRPLWLWNWSKPGKAVNSSLFAVLLLVTGWWQVGVVIAAGLLVLKCVSLVAAGPDRAARPAARDRDRRRSSSRLTRMANLIAAAATVPLSTEVSPFLVGGGALVILLPPRPRRRSPSAPDASTPEVAVRPRA